MDLQPSFCDYFDVTPEAVASMDAVEYHLRSKILNLEGMLAHPFNPHQPGLREEWIRNDEQLLAYYRKCLAEYVGGVA